MGLRKSFGTNKKLETEGVEIAVDTNDHNKEQIFITIGRMSRNNQRYQKALEAKLAPYQAAIQSETLDEDIARRLIREVFVDVILFGWRNMPMSDITGDDTDTSIAEYSPELAHKLFDDMPDVYDAWEVLAKKTATFREANRDTSAKN